MNKEFIIINIKSQKEDNMELRICNKCGEEKEMTDVYYRMFKLKETISYSHTCKSCYAAYIHEYHIINHEKIVLRKAKKRHENYEETIKKEHEYHQKHKVRDNEYSKKRYMIRKEYHKLRHREYYATNKDKILKYTQEYNLTHPDMMKNVSKRRNEKIRSLPSSLTESEYIHTQEYFNNKCAYCGTHENICKDHLIPVCKNGGYVKNNIIPCCKKCNHEKSHLDFKSWYLGYRHYTPERHQKIIDFINTY